MRQIIPLLALLILLMLDSSAQQTLKDAERNPIWINMMDDTLTNYFIAQNAYEQYWNHHTKPLQEEETMGMKGATPSEEKDKESWMRRFFGRNKKQEEKEMRYQCKRFDHWLMINQPYVQDDGRILFPYERLKIWEETSK